jgi:hypothetical protein
MTKAELVDYVAERIQLPKYQAEAVVTSVLQGIMDALRAGDKVELREVWQFAASPPSVAGRTQPENRGHGADSRHTGPLVSGGESPPHVGESAQTVTTERAGTLRPAPANAPPRATCLAHGSPLQPPVRLAAWGPGHGEEEAIASFQACEGFRRHG